MTKKTRVIQIDLLRFIGLSLIILAHVKPPVLLFEIRSFDVPLMLFISGVSFVLAGKSNVSFYSYVFSRFKRLVLPAWIFLSFFFLVVFLFKINVFLSELKVKNVLSAYLLFGFGYVWVIRLFMIIAVISPLLLFLSRRCNIYLFLFFIFSILIFNEFLMYLVHNLDIQSKLIMHLLDDVIFQAIPYAVIFCLGIRSAEIEGRVLVITFITSMIVFCCYAISTYISFGHFVFSFEYKYPPSLYFISFAIVMIFLSRKLVYILYPSNYCDRLPWLINFISSNTIWIYLWHIGLVEYMIREKTDVSFLLKYIFVYFIATLITYLQVKLVSIVSSRISNEVFRKNVNIIFTG